MTPLTPTAQKRLDARDAGTYDIYIEIDIDCVELLDAIGLDYKESEDDMSQNEVCISLNKALFSDIHTSF